MKIVAISDLHGHLISLPPADVICIAGDISPVRSHLDIEAQWRWYQQRYLPWVESLPCKKVITVAGNNDYCFLHQSPISTSKHIYLQNTGVEIEGYTFYGSPNVPKSCSRKAFSKKSEKLVELFARIPHKLDVLICHSTPYGANGCGVMAGTERDKGCIELSDAIRSKDIRYMVCGHIHTGNHTPSLWENTIVANVALCNECKQPTYPPFQFEL